MVSKRNTMLMAFIIVMSTVINKEIDAANDESISLSCVAEHVPTGATYVRWGRTVCNTDTSRIVYTGIAAGAYGNDFKGSVTEIGGGANYLCLTKSPLYMDDATAEVEEARSKIYGAEYRNGGQYTTHWFNVPCVVCEAAGGRTQQIMVPGTYKCPNGWTNEYSGRLNAARHNNPRSTYVCVDSKREVIPDTKPDESISYLYRVEGMCSPTKGGLPCGPYVNGKELSCAVCSK